jgi:hypothetical protein
MVLNDQLNKEFVTKMQLVIQKKSQARSQQLRVYLFLWNIIDAQAILRPRHNKAYHSWIG